MIYNTEIKTQVSLPAIKHVEIKSKLLQQVWGNHLLTESFGQLETFQIYGAHKEKTILPIAAAQGMKKLEELFVGDFSSVEKFFDCEVPPSDGCPRESLLPQLRKLEIDTLPMLKCIPWRVLNIKNLRFLSISGVSSLTCLFPVSTSSGFEQLEKLDIKNCETLEEIFGGDKRASYTTEGGVAIPRLWSLQLEDLPQLSSFSSENCVIELPCLEVVKFTHCPMFGVFERMKHVKELTAIECSLSKRLYKGEPCDRPEVLPQTRSISWAKLSAPHLHFLSISGANGLKSLFSTFECKEFVRLEEIRITECEDLEVIVSNEEKEGDMAPAKALFPRLRMIKLSKLENLGCFISGEYAWEFPSLEVVKIDGCPNMEKFSFAPLRTPKLRNMEIGRAEKSQTVALMQLYSIYSIKRYVE
ncbi:hypothetical protein Nepgr_013608 [Nepenthes gracilis]|uniref:Disease resistance protein At4g27190-like leucine-rich repeats domain-containing protein n=1 Tax=Nepenthes gracilis TaxID=150966 RepID=A0AAD3SIQ7_NEPGR|nr:hypothetical protein Nepgr_013608 [Nepenthes gracilis]